MLKGTLLCYFCIKSGMTKLSVNINKIATLRNARGGDQPNILQVAKDAQAFGAQGITVHPRPDERHITYQDARELPTVITTEFNIEGNPIPKFIDMVCAIKPDQVTLGTRCSRRHYFQCRLGYGGQPCIPTRSYSRI
jgi:hypothetical protein